MQNLNSTFKIEIDLISEGGNFSLRPRRSFLKLQARFEFCVTQILIFAIHRFSAAIVMCFLSFEPAYNDLKLRRIIAKVIKDFPKVQKTRFGRKGLSNQN